MTLPIGTPVWAQRNGKSVRAKVHALSSPTTAVLRDRYGAEWTAPVDSLVPCVSGPEGTEMVRQQRMTIAKASEHLREARRIAKGER